MANTYLLLIDNVYIQPIQNGGTDDELTSVITKVDYRYEATSEDGTVVNYKDSKFLEDPNVDSFKAYETITYEEVQDWVRHSTSDEEELFKILDAQISEIENQKYVKAEKTPWEIQITNIPPDENE